MDLTGFDGVFTDPPYNRSTATNCPVEGRLGEPEFSNEEFLRLADRTTKTDAFLVTFANFPNAAELLVASKGGPWSWKTTLVWDKRPTRTWVSWGRPLKCIEYVLFFTKGDFHLSFKTGEVKPRVERSSFGGGLKARGKKNEAEASYGMFEEVVALRPPTTRVHPTEKPVGWSELVAKVVGRDLRVLDPFCGSGALLSSFPDSVGVDQVVWSNSLPSPPLDEPSEGSKS
jgi:DNA modification methylase